MKFITQIGLRLGIYTQISFYGFYGFDGFEYYCNDDRFNPPTKTNSTTPLFLNYIKRKI